MRLKVGNIFTEVVSASQKELAELRMALTVTPPKQGLPYCFLEDNRQFLSGLIGRIDFPFEVENEDEDQEIPEIPADLLNGAVLRDYQLAMVRKALFRKRGLVVAPTGSGKTITSAAIAKHLEDTQDAQTLILVPGLNSMHQMWRRWTDYGLSDVGRLGGGFKEWKSRHLIAVVNSFHKLTVNMNSKLLSWSEDLDAVQFMEVQHLPAATWSQIGMSLDVPYRLGLSATPYSNQDGPVTVEDFRLLGLTGDPVIEFSDTLLMDRGHMATPRVHMLSVNSTWLGGERDWHKIRREALVGNAARNATICNLASKIAGSGSKVILLVSEIGHGKKLAREISKNVHPTFMFHGGSKLILFCDGREDQLRTVPIYELADILAEEDSYVLVGSPAVDEDADFPDANVLILGGAGRSFRRIIQRVGRILRPKPNSNTVDLIDFDDRGSFVLRNQSRLRKRYYTERYSKARDFRLVEYSDEEQVVSAVCGKVNDENIHG